MADYLDLKSKEFLLNEPAINRHPLHQPILADLQAHILHHHRKQYSAYLFLSFEDKDEIRKWMAEYAGKLTTSLTLLEAKPRTVPAVVRCLYLTFKGYEYLGLSNLAPESEAYRRGIEPVTLGFNKNGRKAWLTEWKKEEDTLHAMVLLASDNKSSLDKAVEELKFTLADRRMAKWCQEDGRLFRSKSDKNSEWFGYKDGISQPLFFPTCKDDSAPL